MCPARPLGQSELPGGLGTDLAAAHAIVSGLRHLSVVGDLQESLGRGLQSWTLVSLNMGPRMTRGPWPPISPPVACDLNPSGHLPMTPLHTSCSVKGKESFLPCMACNSPPKKNVFPNCLIHTTMAALFLPGQLGAVGPGRNRRSFDNALCPFL